MSEVNIALALERTSNACLVRCKFIPSDGPAAGKMDVVYMELPDASKLRKSEVIYRAVKEIVGNTKWLKEMTKSERLTLRVFTDKSLIPVVETVSTVVVDGEPVSAHIYSEKCASDVASGDILLEFLSESSKSQSILFTDDKAIEKRVREHLDKAGEDIIFKTGAVREPKIGKGRCDLLPASAILRISKLYEKGAERYGDRNWEKGLPISSFLDSGLRHLLKYLDGQTDEDHLCAAAWNLLGAMWTEEKHPECIDIPALKKEDKNNEER